jgi:hypothetical protein
MMAMNNLAELQSWHNPTIITKSLIDDLNSTEMDYKGALYVMGPLDTYGLIRFREMM